jgi:hypothetical protein
MAQLSFTIPDNLMPDVIEAFVHEFSYQQTINGFPNPQTQAQFTKAQIAEHIKLVTKRYKAGVAATAAEAAAIANVDSGLIIT